MLLNCLQTVLPKGVLPHSIISQLCQISHKRSPKTIHKSYLRRTVDTKLVAAADFKPFLLVLLFCCLVHVTTLVRWLSRVGHCALRCSHLTPPDWFDNHHCDASETSILHCSKTWTDWTNFSSKIQKMPKKCCNCCSTQLLGRKLTTKVKTCGMHKKKKKKSEKRKTS